MKAEWLVRTVDNRILGPYSKDRICILIREGRLQLDDEVCEANGYWVALHETDEVARQLGVRIVSSGTDEEITETQTETQTETRTEPGAAWQTEPHTPFVEHTLVLSRPRAALEPRPTPRPSCVSSRSHTPAPHSLGLDGTSIWRGLVWLLITGGAILVYAVLHLTRTR